MKCRLSVCRACFSCSERTTQYHSQIILDRKRVRIREEIIQAKEQRRKKNVAGSEMKKKKNEGASPSNREVGVLRGHVSHFFGSQVSRKFVYPFTVHTIKSWMNAPLRVLWTYTRFISKVAREISKRNQCNARDLCSQINTQLLLSLLYNI